MSGSQELQQNLSQDNEVSSSNLVEIKKLHSMLKSATEKLELCSIASDCARRELVKCKKVLKPCTCKPCNDINSSLRQLESNIQEANLDHHIKSIERSVDAVVNAYRLYNSAHAQDWDI